MPTQNLLRLLLLMMLMLRNVEVITVAYVSDDDRVGNSLVQIWKLKFGHKAKFCSDFEHKV